LQYRPRTWNPHSKFIHKNGQASALPSCLGKSTPRMSILDDGLPKRVPERRIHCCHANSHVEEYRRGVNVMAAKKGYRGKLDAAAECVCMTIPEHPAPGPLDSASVYSGRRNCSLWSVDVISIGPGHSLATLQSSRSTSLPSSQLALSPSSP